MNKERLIHEAILNDKGLQQLYSQKARIYTLVTPVVILRNGKAETIWFDETNHPELPKINKLIDHRIDQIKHFYN